MKFVMLTCCPCQISLLPVYFGSAELVWCKQRLWSSCVKFSGAVRKISCSACDGYAVCISVSHFVVVRIFLC